MSGYAYILCKAPQRARCGLSEYMFSDLIVWATRILSLREIFWTGASQVTDAEEKENSPGNYQRSSTQPPGPNQANKPHVDSIEHSFKTINLVPHFLLPLNIERKKYIGEEKLWL